MASSEVTGLRVTGGGRTGAELRLDGDLEIGREVDGAGRISDDDQLSRRHARIRRDAEGRAFVEDLDSTNGTYLNGWRIPTAQYLSAGDALQMGKSSFSVIGTAPPAPGLSRVRQIPPSVAAGALSRSAPAKAGPVLQAVGVTKSYGDHQVLHGLDLTVEPGEIVGLLGGNGAGKTTFVSIVAGLRRADGGSVRVGDVDALANPRAARKLIGIAPQDLGVYEGLTVHENLDFFGELGGLHAGERVQRVGEIAEALSLDSILGQQAATLSGGQKRRLHTGMALLHRPPLVILDEPTVGADVRTRAEILEVVRGLAAEGCAVCYSTHYLPEIERLGASVAILEGGRIIARDTIADLIARHSETALELHFDGAAPDLGIANAIPDGSVLRISTDSPAQAAATALPRLGADAVRLEGIEIVRPSLESVYLSLTGRRYQGAEEAGGSSEREEAGVAAA